ncbi:MAG: penicillin-insensitive murein endopeptidase [Bdellovibrionales bacterium]|nr:penicillin-insensitive murein endopeptidase [Bdellovibrionales bacterium]
MKKRSILCLAITLAAFIPVTWADGEALDNPWTKIKSPASGQAESIGVPSAGCLRGAQALPDQGPGYKLMRPSRGRTFGHPRLIATIEQVGKILATAKKPPLLIGDLGLPRGGPTLSAHSSHQTGLDVDIWYLRHRPWRNRKNVSVREREKLQATKMVDRKKLAALPAFGKEERAVLQLFAENPEVDRILVNFAIKRELCKTVPQEPWIRKIRPWFGHDHHFHVRLLCSPSDRLCRTNTDPLPEGNSCDSSLDWWWSEEARQDEAKSTDRQEHPVMPNLPAECAPLTKDL